MSSINDVPPDVIALHVASRLPFDKLCACVSCGGSLGAAALMLLRTVPRIRTLQELKFRERACVVLSCRCAALPTVFAGTMASIE